MNPRLLKAESRRCPALCILACSMRLEPSISTLTASPTTNLVKRLVGKWMESRGNIQTERSSRHIPLVCLIRSQVLYIPTILRLLHMSYLEHHASIWTPDDSTVRRLSTWHTQTITTTITEQSCVALTTTAVLHTYTLVNYDLTMGIATQVLISLAEKPSCYASVDHSCFSHLTKELVSSLSANK